MGQKPQESFQTVDLFENQNMMAVVIQLHSLGRLAQAMGFAGPKLGVKVVEKNERTFTEEQLREARAEQTFLGKGSHGTVGGSMSKAHVGKQYARGADGIAGLKGLGVGGEASLVGKGAHGTPGSRVSTSELSGYQIDKSAMVQGGGSPK